MGAAELLAQSEIITVEQFLDMELPDTCEWHLVDGTVLSVTHPRFPHSLVQRNIQEQLRELLTGVAMLFTELGYELDPRNSPRADVAAVSLARAGETLKTGGIFHGAPDLVVEVMSRSNEPYDVDDLERRCLAGGAAAFWVVTIENPRRRRALAPDYTVRAGRLVGGRVEHTLHGRGSNVPVDLLGVSGAISVDRIFEGLV